MLDAPVSGSQVTLLAGRLSIMVGGKREVFEQVKPILEAIGPTVNYVGENGLAVTMKVATNLSLPVQVLAFCESILLAEKSGIARETAIEVLLNSVVASPALQYRIPLILEPPEEPLFDVHMMQKDLKLALEMGEALGGAASDDGVEQPVADGGPGIRGGGPGFCGALRGFGGVVGGGGCPR